MLRGDPLSLLTGAELVPKPNAAEGKSPWEPLCKDNAHMHRHS